MGFDLSGCNPKMNKKLDVKYLNESQEKALLEIVYSLILEAFDDTEDSDK